MPITVANITGNANNIGNKNYEYHNQCCINTPRGPWVVKLMSSTQVLFYSNWIMLLSGGNLVTF